MAPYASVDTNNNAGDDDNLELLQADGNCNHEETEEEEDIIVFQQSNLEPASGTETSAAQTEQRGGRHSSSMLADAFNKLAKELIGSIATKTKKRKHQHSRLPQEEEEENGDSNNNEEGAAPSSNVPSPPSPDDNHNATPKMNKNAESPEIRASIFSRAMFSWLDPLMHIGYKRPLTEDDIWHLRPDMASQYSYDLVSKQWEKELRAAGIYNNAAGSSSSSTTTPYYASKQRRKQPSLLRAIMKSYYDVFIFSIIVRVPSEILILLGPFLLQYIVQFVTQTQAQQQQQQQQEAGGAGGASSPLHPPPPPAYIGYIYAVLLFFVPALQSLSRQNFFAVLFKMTVGVQAALSGLVYRKTLKLSAHSKQKSRTGEVMNLMSVDITRIAESYIHVNEAWSIPFQIVASFLLLYQVIGASAIITLLSTLLSVPVSYFFTSKYRRNNELLMKVKDERVNLVNELLLGIRVVKYFAWEKPFLKTLLEVRNREYYKMIWSSVYQCLLMYVSEITPILVAVATFTFHALVYGSNSLTSDTVFTALSLFNVMRRPLIVVPETITAITNANVSSKRIQDYLLLEEVKDISQKPVAAKSPSNSSSSSSSSNNNNNSNDDDDDDDLELEEELDLGAEMVRYQNASFTWDPELSRPTLSNISMCIKPGQLVCVVGEVGSGKSSLLCSIFGEMTKVEGEVKISSKTRFSYCAQEPWILNDTLRGNILFGQPFDQSKYDEVIDVCALRPDLGILPAGDLTEIGENGINLSGGTRYRVSLARAVYNGGDIYLLDSPLAAVDAHTAKHIFFNCIMQKLKGKTRVLVTHSMQFLPHSDLIIVMRGGEIIEMGTYEQLLSDATVFSSLINIHSSAEEATVTAAAAATSASAQQEGADVVAVEAVETSDGDGDGDGDVRLELVATGTTTSNTTSTCGETTNTNEGDRSNSKTNPASAKPAATLIIKNEEREVGALSWRVYTRYFLGYGKLFLLAILVVGVIAQAGTVVADSWMGIWTSDVLSLSSKYSSAATVLKIYLGAYFGITLFNGIFSLLRLMFFYFGGLVTGNRMHAAMLNAILRAPISFFDRTPTGRIMNRFSKDQSEADQRLPHLLTWVYTLLFKVASVIVVISIVTPLFILMVIPIGIAYIALQQFYRSSSRELKRLVSITRSPIFSHFSSSISGASTIRAFKQSERFCLQNMRHVDNSLRMYYTSNMVNRWVGLRLETIGALVVFGSALFVVIAKNSLNPTFAGLSISYALTVTMLLNWFVRTWVDSESLMTSVERIYQYAEIESEAPDVIENNRPPAHWPSRGEIKFKNVEMRYRPELEPVLRGISFVIRPGEKVGIVGRTGSGKSSLLNALFRIIELSGGSIEIDGVDIGKIGLADLRSKMVIIPQTPVVFSGTIRSNLDPFHQYTDAEMWSALERVHMHRAIANLPLKLDNPVAENGSNFSVGERQLLCLARALLRDSKIIVLDEATANVDVEADQMIQQTVREQLSDRTVLTIAHRLNTIIDSDRVMVLRDGQLVEFDSPANLLARREESLFFKLISESDKSKAKTICSSSSSKQ